MPGSPTPPKSPIPRSRASHFMRAISARKMEKIPNKDG